MYVCLFALTLLHGETETNGTKILLSRTRARAIRGNFVKVRSRCACKIKQIYICYNSVKPKLILVIAHRFLPKSAVFTPPPAESNRFVGGNEEPVQRESEREESASGTIGAVLKFCHLWTDPTVPDPLTVRDLFGERVCLAVAGAFFRANDSIRRG